ncbi:phosphorylase [Calothrix sp. UHCC 0171]|uniref:5'-methylthioadenosine/S-adenosylhomocysteine nucleosidase family protein n=1 Tax=Calothrix sp. UHCC 0171 TaxID=3110245 RepID=UPI002B2207B2|nr:phosphorylase [Calothrix sp. UHCC 0171]MEA5572434.1 phosphorylase [Calothrix sp. UHCC 0171]
MNQPPSAVNSSIQVILVPQGAEYQAVRKGLSCIQNQNCIHTDFPQPIAIPIGSPGLIQYLQNLDKIAELRKQVQPKILIMGLCGSLKEAYQVGDVVIYESCIYHQNLNHKLIREFDRSLTNDLEKQLKLNYSQKISRVKGITCDRIISSAQEKQHLAETNDVDVVDMEGFAILDFFNSLSASVGMVRVVSDDSQHDLPDLNFAISPEGSLKTLPLALGMLRQPIAATRLIKGSLQGLKVLEQITTDLFQVKN